MKNFFFLLFSIMASTCFAQNREESQINFYEVSDLNFSITDELDYKNYYKEAGNSTEYLKEFYKPFTAKNIKFSKKEVNSYLSYDENLKSPCYAGNLSTHTDKIKKEIQANIVIKSLNPNSKKFALTITNCDLRELPTDEYCLKSPRDAGEGYPFDYYQNSSLWIGSALRIMASSVNGSWHLVYSSNGTGWIKDTDLVIINQAQVENYMERDHVVVTKDLLIAKGLIGNYKLMLGTILTSKNTSVLIPTKQENKMVYDPLAKQDALQEFPIRMGKLNIKKILSELHNSKYSWGGIDGGRDCSSTLKDYFSCFGIWIPRNSYDQATYSSNKELDKIASNKSDEIKQIGIPFVSMIYKKGHIVLYVGENQNGTPLIYHNTWGLKLYKKNKKLYQLAAEQEKNGLYGVNQSKGKKNFVESRINIGKTVITEIDPGIIFKDDKKTIPEYFLDNFYIITTPKK